MYQEAYILALIVTFGGQAIEKALKKEETVWTCTLASNSDDDDDHGVAERAATEINLGVSAAVS